MKKLVEYIITSIVDHPKEVRIKEEESKEAGEGLFLTVSVHPEDIGRVIGKEGKIIKAIRRLSHILAIKKKKTFNLELLEGQSSEKGSSFPDGTRGKAPSKPLS